MKFERKWERVRGLLTTEESLICGSGSERGNWRTIMKLGGFERERERESDGKAWSFCKKIWKNRVFANFIGRLYPSKTLSTEFPSQNLF